jgi:hypothetical protein
MINGKFSLNALKNLDNYINSSNILTSKLTVYVVIDNSIDEIPNKIKENYIIITLG